MELYGLIGKKLEHSFSPSHYADKFQTLGIHADYHLFELDHISKLPQIINENPNLIGLNITIPFKKEVIQILDHIDDIAEQIGAVNTIKIDRKGSKIMLVGYNTDVIGFEQALIPVLKNYKNVNALILGTGGGAQAVAFVLDNLGIQNSFVSRNISTDYLTYEMIDQEVIDNHNLIINTTPLGMFPNINTAPQLPYHLARGNHVFFDLVYNPEETLFMKLGKASGARVFNGQRMLELQADASWNIWKS